MLRKLNFTERAKIPRSAVRVTLRREADGVLAFDPHISLEGIAAPSGSRLFVEAYHRTSYMRFDCGTIGEPAVPEDRRLTEIDGSSVRFRLRVVDPSHRILAVADDIRVTEREPGGGTESPLLPVDFIPLDQLSWRVYFDVDTPVLQLNNSIDGIEKLARDDALFFALVYPAAVREILTHILVIDDRDASEGTNEWWDLWLRWASRYTSSPVPADPEDAPHWIDEVVGAFCCQHRVVDRLNGREEPS